MNDLAIGIDLGCTNIKGVLINASGEILYELREPTLEQDTQHWQSAVRKMISDLEAKTNQNVVAIGLSAPGLANPVNECIAYMPGRLPGLENFNWSKYTHRRVIVLNDAHAALMSEAKFGAARNCQHAVLITLGSGVGGGILINGNLYQGLHQMAGHLGHITVDSDFPLRDVTNMPGSIEDAFGEVSILQRTHGKFNNTEKLVQAYLKGETFATYVWLSSVRKLAIHIASLINLLSPEKVILGGGISKAGDALMLPLRDFLNEYEWQPGGLKSNLGIATFSDLAGALGAAAFALNKK